jgi:RNA polymerase sigma-70 factor (ECF subfamily)
VDVDDADERSLLRTGPNPTWEEVATRTSTSELRAAIAALPDEQRRSVELAYFEGYTYREVAQLTGVPPGTANGRMRLALAKLREALGDTAAAPNAATGSQYSGEARS